MDKHIYFKIYMTFSGGLTETVTDDSLMKAFGKAQHQRNVAHVEGMPLTYIRISKMMENGDELGPYEITYVED